jgi:hypothetical protein
MLAVAQENFVVVNTDSLYNRDTISRGRSCCAINYFSSFNSVILSRGILNSNSGA